MDLSEASDFELMQAVAGGSQPAFVVLVHRYQQVLFKFFWHMGTSQTASEDLVQEVFLRIFAYRRRYRPTAKFTTFLYSIARCVWADQMRKRPLLRKISEDIADPKDYVADVEREMDVRDALPKLPEKLRTALVMSLYQCLKYQEIAEILDIPVGTVKSRIFHAIRQLREILSERKSALHP